jgi:hypothetical protein
MTERDRQPQQTSEAKQQAPWPILALAEALHTSPLPAEDSEFGAGHLFQLGENKAVNLELYPAAGVVRLIGPGMSLELRQQAAPHVRRRGTIFTSEDASAPLTQQSRLVVSNKGEALFSLQQTTLPNVTESPKSPSTPPKWLIHRSEQ